MRTTVRLDDDLLTAAKRRAADQGISLTRLIEEALRERLARGGGDRRRPDVKLPVSDMGGGLMPGVDLDSNARLRELMDEGLPIHKRR